MGDIGPLRQRFEVLAGADLEGPSLERLAQAAGRVAEGGPRSPSSPSSAAPPAAAGQAGEQDDTSAG